MVSIWDLSWGVWLNPGWVNCDQYFLQYCPKLNVNHSSSISLLGPESGCTVPIGLRHLHHWHDLQMSWNLIYIRVQSLLTLEFISLVKNHVNEASSCHPKSEFQFCSFSVTAMATIVSKVGNYYTIDNHNNSHRLKRKIIFLKNEYELSFHISLK